MGTGSEGIQVQGPMSTWFVLALGQCVVCTAILKVLQNLYIRDIVCLALEYF